MIRVEGLEFEYGGGVPRGRAQPGHQTGPFRLRVDKLDIAQGEHAALVGASGSGKTTLISLITGVLAAPRGVIELAGREVTGMSDAQRRAHRAARVGLVFQEFELLDYLSALDNILIAYRVAGGASGLALTREVRDRAGRLAAALGVAHLLNRGPARLSQGERQRVALCRALVTRPGVVICDEPTGNLDPRSADAALDLLFEQARATGATLLVVTHNHGVLGRFDRTLHMEHLAGHPVPDC